MYVKDIAFKLVGMLASRHVLTTARGNATLTVVVVASKSVAVIVLGACLVLDHVKVRHIAAAV